MRDIIVRADHKKGYFVQLCNEAVREAARSLGDAFSAWCVLMTVTPSGTFKISREWLASELGVSERTCARMLNKLKAEGYLTITADRQKNAFYWTVYEDKSLSKSIETTGQICHVVTEGTTGQICHVVQNQQIFTESLAGVGETLKNDEGDHVTDLSRGYNRNNKNTKKTVGDKSPQQHSKRTNQKRFTPPTAAEVGEYCSECKNGIDPQRFVDYYEAQGWQLSNGRQMKDWRAAVRLWESRDKKQAEEAAKKSSSGTIQYKSL